MKMFASTALVAVLALSTFGIASAETVEIKTGVVDVTQGTGSMVTQTSGAVTAAIGEVRNNAEVKALSANTNVTSDIDQEIDANGASAHASESFSGSLNGSYYDQGNYTTATGGALAGSGFGVSLAASGYDATSGAWNNGGSLGANVSYSASTDLPSLSLAASDLGVTQYTVGPVMQTSFALAGSGAVTDYSKLGATSVNQNVGSTVKVVVKN